MKKLAALFLALFVLAGCTRPNPFTESSESESSDTAPTTEAKEGTESETTKTEETLETEETTEEELANRDPSSVDLSYEPSEGGKIMVLMYHNIGEEEEPWVRTPDNFRADLQYLYEEGYRPIRLTDYARGHIDTPAGMTPYVITFDDARENNFRYLADGSIDPDCAVGILMEFAEMYEDFSPHATFFSNSPIPFRVEGEEVEKVQFLIDNGMDIGNHTWGHEDFTWLNGDELQESIGSQAEYLDTIVPEGYEVNTLALPFGSRPEDGSFTHYLREGSYNGFAYNNIAILNVGWDPAYSPFHVNFDPESIPRIRASEMEVDDVGIYNWLSYFESNPEERFISDGNPYIVSAPADWADVMEAPEGLILNLYETGETEE